MSDPGAHIDPKGVWDRPHQGDPARFQKISLHDTQRYFWRGRSRWWKTYVIVNVTVAGIVLGASIRVLVGILCNDY